MPAPEHDAAVAFADVIVPGSAIDLSGWECWTHRDGDTVHYYARGPCPACHATAQGNADTTTNPVESLGRPQATIPEERSSEPVEVPVRCRCGHAHGREGGASCGRRWSILCPGERP